MEHSENHEWNTWNYIDNVDDIVVYKIETKNHTNQ